MKVLGRALPKVKNERLDKSHVKTSFLDLFYREAKTSIKEKEKRFEKDSVASPTGNESQEIHNYATMLKQTANDIYSGNTCTVKTRYIHYRRSGPWGSQSETKHPVKE